MLSEQGSPGPRGDLPDLETQTQTHVEPVLEERLSLNDTNPILAEVAEGALGIGGMIAVMGLCPPAAVYLATITFVEEVKKAYHRMKVYG